MNELVSAAKIAERLLSRPNGATMDEIIAATGGPQYNVLRRLKARGVAVRSVKEGRTTRYVAEQLLAPAATFDAEMSADGRVTIPEEVRSALGLVGGKSIRFTLGAGRRAVLTPGGLSVQRLFGALGQPPRSATPEEIGEGIRNAAVERYLRTVKKRS